MFIDALYVSGVGRVLRDYEQRYTLGDDSVPMPDTESRDSRTQLEVVAAAVASSGLPVGHTEKPAATISFAPTAAVGGWRK